MDDLVKNLRADMPSKWGGAMKCGTCDGSAKIQGHHPSKHASRWVPCPECCHDVWVERARKMAADESANEIANEIGRLQRVVAGLRQECICGASRISDDALVEGLHVDPTCTKVRDYMERARGEPAKTDESLDVKLKTLVSTIDKALEDPL